MPACRAQVEKRGGNRAARDCMQRGGLDTLRLGGWGDQARCGLEGAAQVCNANSSEQVCMFVMLGWGRGGVLADLFVV